jgi:hypothetical protein
MKIFAGAKLEVLMRQITHASTHVCIEQMAVTLNR